MKSIESFKDSKLEINAMSKVLGMATSCTVFEEEWIDGDHFIYGDDYDDEGNQTGCWVQLVNGFVNTRIYMEPHEC